MKYLIDNCSMSSKVLSSASGRNDVFTIQDVVDEYAHTESEVHKLHASGMQVLEINIQHLEMLIEVLKTQGDNFKLVSLYTGEGTADLLILAYILAEEEFEKSTSLFPEKWCIVTEDSELVRVAKESGIVCLSAKEFLSPP